MSFREIYPEAAQYLQAGETVRLYGDIIDATGGDPSDLFAEQNKNPIKSFPTAVESVQLTLGQAPLITFTFEDRSERYAQHVERILRTTYGAKSAALRLELATQLSPALHTTSPGIFLRLFSPEPATAFRPLEVDQGGNKIYRIQFAAHLV